jgi:hypothetical protein
LKTVSNGGYPQVSLSRAGGMIVRKVHRLMVDAFLTPTDGSVCNHKDGHKDNNRLDNLECVSSARNCRHAFEHGLRKPLPSHSHPFAKLTYESARSIRERYAAKEATQTQLAAEHGVSQTVIYRVVNGKSWHR